MTIARTRAALAVGVIAVGLTVAACGSSSGSSTTSASGAQVASTAPGSVSRSAFRTCLEKHGITLPRRRPPGAGGPPGGGFFGGGGGGGGGAAGRFNDPKFRAAVQACGGFRGGFRGGPRRFRLSHAVINSFVVCVRKNGYAQMPNPNFSGGPIFPASIRTNKQFQAASRKCVSTLRQARPAGATSTNPGA